MAKESIKVIGTNRRASFDYVLDEFYEAGIVLSGTEVKSLRAGAVNMRDSYVYIKDFEVFVSHMHISHYDKGNINNVDPDRDRKLLLHKHEITKLVSKMQQKGYTLIPTKIYFVRNKVKLEVALAKGKKLYDKRESMREQQAEKEIQKRLKGDYRSGA